MLSRFRNHPFAIDTNIQLSAVLTFAIEKNKLQSFLPVCLEPDTFENKWGFIAVAFVKAAKLRPKGLPALLGQNFILAGYRIFVRYKTSEGKRLRGLYILRSETNCRRMLLLGNLFTQYRYHYSDVNMFETNEELYVVSKRSGINVQLRSTESAQASLPPSSPFANWNEARRYAGPLPFTFSYNDKTNKVLIVEGQRSKWNPQPATVVKAQVGFIHNMGLGDLLLANSFILRDVPYHWKKGKVELWKPSL